MKVKKEPISKEKAIELYKSGMSQKDIMNEFEITHKKLSAILRAEGYPTNTFRSLDDSMKRVIMLLIQNGIQYQEIENVCDISFHAIRELVIKADLQGATRRIRISSIRVYSFLPSALEEAFFAKYCSGTTFCAACDALELSDEQVFQAYCSTKRNKEALEAHRKALKEQILSDVAAGFSTTAIANKRKLSRSLVKKLL